MVLPFACWVASQPSWSASHSSSDSGAYKNPRLAPREILGGAKRRPFAVKQTQDADSYSNTGNSGPPRRRVCTYGICPVSSRYSQRRAQALSTSGKSSGGQSGKKIRYPVIGCVLSIVYRTLSNSESIEMPP